MAIGHLVRDRGARDQLTCSRWELAMVVRGVQSTGPATVERIAAALESSAIEALREELDAAVSVGLLERMHLYSRRNPAEQFRLRRVSYQAIRNPLIVAGRVHESIGPPSPVWPPRRTPAPAPAPPEVVRSR